MKGAGASLWVAAMMGELWPRIESVDRPKLYIAIARTPASGSR
jgi:hypothetical protein